jgi:hypothetical protein
MRRIPPRTIERQSCELECSIEATDSAPERRALLRNLSQTGARLEGSELEGCPETFELRIVHHSGAVERLFARVVWRQASAVGVRFEEPHSIAPRRRLQPINRAG